MLKILIILGNSSNATTSNNTTSAQPTRRARFKPKVGIVAQRSPGKATNQAKVSAESPINATKPGTKTPNSPVTNVGGNRTLHAKRPDSSRPSAGTNKITVTATVHSHPSISQQSSGQQAKTSTLLSKGVGSQSSVNTSTSTLPVSKDGDQQPSVSTNTITVHGEPSTDTSIDTTQKVGTSKDTFTTIVGDQPSNDGQQSSGSTSTGVPLMNKNNGSQVSVDISTVPVKDNNTQLPSGTMTDTLPVHKTGATTNQPSHGSQENTVTLSDQISTGTNKDGASANTGSPFSSCNTSTQKTSGSQNVTTNTTATAKPDRRARIRPRVGIVSTKTTVEKNSDRTPVKKTTSSEQTNLLPSVTVSSKDRGAGEDTSVEDTQNLPASSLKITNTDNQPLSGPTIITKTSTTDATGSLETITAQHKEPDNLKRTTPTRRSRITPNVGGKTSKAPTQKTVPESQSASSTVAPSSVTSPSGKEISQPSASNENENTSSLARSENVDATVVERSSNNVGQPVHQASSEKTSSLQDNSSTNGDHNNKRPNASLEVANDIDQPSSSTTTASPNQNSSVSENTTKIATPAPQLTRRARFKPRVGIVGRPTVQPQKNQAKTSTVNNPPTLSRNLAGNNRQRLTVGREKSVSKEIVNTQQNTVSVSSTSVENERLESGSIIERGDEDVVDNGLSDSTVGNETLRSTVSEMGERAGEEIPMEGTRTLSNMLGNDQVQCDQTSDLPDQSTLLSRDELSDKRQQSVATQNSNSTAEQNETCSENYLSSDPRTLQDSLQDVVILRQDNEAASRSTDSSSPSCLPVMMEDRSILPQDSITCDGLASGLDVEDTSELSTQMTALVNMDSEFPYLYHIQSADDLLQTLLNAGNLGSDYAPQGKNRVSVDTSSMSLDINRISVNSTTPNIHADPNKSIPTLNQSIPTPNQPTPNQSILTPNQSIPTPNQSIPTPNQSIPTPNQSIPTPSSITRLESSTSRQSSQTETLLNRSRTLPQNKQTQSTINKRQGPMLNNQAVPNNQGVLHSQAATTSSLVIKRQRSKPKKKQPSLPVETSDLDISTIPIASNIEIEPEISADDNIDHPVLELPVDLIQEDLTQNSPKANTSSGGLKQRFQQRRSGTVKLVLSRKRPESSVVDTADKGSTEEGSTAGDKSNVSGDTSGSTTVVRSAGDSSAKSGSKVGTVKSREITRKVRPQPNIQVRRKANKTSNQKESAAEKRILDEGISVEDNADTTRAGLDTVPGLEKSNSVEEHTSITNTSQEELTNVLESVSDVSKSSSSVDVSGNSTTNENTTFRFGLERSTGVATEGSVVHELPSDIQSESELRDAGLDISDNVQNSTNSTVEEKRVSSSGGANDIESQSCVTDTSVHDLSKDDEIEIVLEVIGTAQGYTDIVCGGAASRSNVSHGGVKQTGIVDASFTNDIENESVSERSTIQDNVCNDNENTTSSLQQSSDAVHSQTSTADANLPDNIGDSLIDVGSALADDSQAGEFLHSTGTSKQKPVRSESESLVNLKDSSLAKPGKTIEENYTNDGQTKGIPESGNEDSLTTNSGLENVGTEPISTHTHDTLPSLPVSILEENLSNNSPRLTGSRSKEISGSKGVMSAPKSSTPLHELSLDAPENAFALTSDVEYNNDSQFNTDDILADKNRGDNNPISLPEIQDISLNIPESAIESAIRNTSEPLPVECPECPELVLCLTTVDEASINHKAHSLSKTQPGTLEDNVARATRRTSRQKPKPNLQRKRKARGKIVDDDESEDTTGGNNGSAIQEDIGNKGTNEKSADDHLGIEEGTIEGASAHDGSLGNSCVQDGSLEDTCVQDGSLEDTSVQPDITAEGSGGLEGSTPEVPGDPIQDDSSKKSGSRKRQGKAVKPKIPAKRTRKNKKAGMTSESVEGCDETEQRSTENPVSFVLRLIFQ